MKKFSKLITFALALTLALALAVPVFAALDGPPWNAGGNGMVRGSNSYSSGTLTITTRYTTTKTNRFFLESGVSLSGYGFGDNYSCINGAYGETPLQYNVPIIFPIGCSTIVATCSHYAYVEDSRGYFLPYGGTTSQTITN